MLDDVKREQLRAVLANRSVPGQKPNKLSKEQRESIPLEYLGGATITQLARKYQVTVQTVDYHLRRAAR